MKIVHVTSSLVKKSAGVGEVVKALSHQQTDLGFDVTVLGLDHPDWELEKEEWSGVKTILVPVFGPRKLGYAAHMEQVLEELQPDIVHLHGLWMHPGRSVLKWHRKTNRPFILSPHGMLSKVALSYSKIKKYLISALFQNEVMANASAFHATSNAEIIEIKDYGIKSKIYEISNGIHEQIPLNGDYSKTDKTIISLGRVHRKKALDQLILAWKKIEQEFPEWSVRIIGPSEGGEDTRLLSLIKDIDVSRVTVEGPVYGTDKIKIMSDASIFALPTYSENFALTVAESLMLEVPVISSHGAPWEGLELEKCGLWVPVGSDSMAEALKKLMLLNDSDRHEMGIRGRNWMIRDFSWSTIAEKFIVSYKDIIKDKL
ncbi:glycosyltransferase [Cobetia amphilecti]|uniref:glycosyltransferase n=1 Tax=Cobetia amphilecti TaxID=1055104 RepID=UPI003296F3B9